MTADETNDAALLSWVEDANQHPDFPVQNLPFGSFSPPGKAARGGVAIGDHILDLAALRSAAIVGGEAGRALEACSGPSLNGFLALGAGPRRALRQAIGLLLRQGAPHRPELLHPAASCQMHVPAEIGDYTDVYAGIHHAVAVGKLFRPDNPLMPNYKWLPAAYHGRASSIGVSDNVLRPDGQRQLPGQSDPSFGPSLRLDYELELGIWIGPGNRLGAPVPVSEAADQVAGFCLLNDWSARDVQAWEYQPLGPFLAKSFCTTISPWIVTPEALAPFRAAQRPRGNGDPAIMPYLFDTADQAGGALALDLEATLLTSTMVGRGMQPHTLSRASSRDLYWTPAQIIAHHTSNGCNLRPGDLIGTGTISSLSPNGSGSLLELTQGGRNPVMLPSGETRQFLEDGDRLSLHARGVAPGAVPIGFGGCSGVVARRE